MKRCCKDCEYSQLYCPGKSDDSYQCRRHAPVFPGNSALPAFPLMGGKSWCGDFKKKKEGAK